MVASKARKTRRHKALIHHVLRANVKQANLFLAVTFEKTEEILTRFISMIDQSWKILDDTKQKFGIGTELPISAPCSCRLSAP